MRVHQSGDWTPELSDAEERTLFAIADDTLRWCVIDGAKTPFSFDKYDLTPKLKLQTATFVTLKKGGMLRGCIGSLVPVQAMYQSVHDNTVNAALRDFRFHAVKPDEIEQIDINISLLSPIVKIRSLDEFHIGQHGIILEKGPFRAVYLPEVAVEQNWNKEQTISSLGMKAGLRRDEWREGAAFSVFSSVILQR